MSVEAICPHCDAVNTWGNCIECEANDWKEHFHAFQLSCVECKKCGCIESPPIYCFECDKKINSQFFKSTSLGAKILKIVGMGFVGLIIFGILLIYSAWDKQSNEVESIDGGEETSNNIISKLKAGMVYKYYSAGGCRIEDANDVCIDEKTYIEICSTKPSISVMAVKGLGHSNSEFSILSSGGVSLNYNISPNTDAPCIINVVADGVLNGTSRTINVVAEPANFIINNSGSILITYAIYRYAE